MKISVAGYAFIIIFVLFCTNAFCQVDVLTQHNDLARTGWNSQETILNTSNVNYNSFGLLYTRTVDDQIFAQPLVVSGVNIPSVGTKNIVFVCTVNNTIYAYDADTSVGAYWSKNLTPSGYRVPNSSDVHPSLCSGVYWDFSGNFGIVGTPVIDKTSNTMYLVTKICSTAGIDNHTYNSSVPNEEYTYTSTGFHQYLHAIDLGTGAEKLGGPVEITASAPGPGDGNVNGTISFDPRRQFNRGGLVLSGGIVYIPYAAHCDWNPAHGWVIGYDATSLQQKIVYITTPNDGRGGIWMSGGAPAVDASGSLYFTTGNAYDDNSKFTDSPSDSSNRGESVVKITPNAPDNTATSIKLSSFFTPYDYAYLNDGDLDFPIQVMLIPNTNWVITGCKDNNLYLMDRTNLGGFNTTTNNVLQTISVGSNAEMHSSLAYFGGQTNQYVYQLSENTLLQAFKVGSTSLGAAVTGNISGPTGLAGGFMSVSSNGSDNSTGILWVYHAANGCNGQASSCQGVLRALRADNIATELWNSSMFASDNIGIFQKMVCPTIANGKVYVNGAPNQLAIYGLATQQHCAPNVALFKQAFASSPTDTIANAGLKPSLAFDGNFTTRWSSNFSDTQYIYVDLGQVYNICQISINWEAALGQNFTVDISNDASTWTTAQAFVGNTSFQNLITGNFQGRYVRMNGTKRGSPYGYSIYEMQVLGTLPISCAAPAGLSIGNITQNGATISWNAVAGATSYVVQYKTPIVSSWVTKTTTGISIPISALTCNAAYSVQVQAVCASGSSTFASTSFTTSACTASCGSLPTRYFSADIGDIGFAGSSCLNNGIYTLNGSGAGITGSSDAFQFAFTDLNGDDEVTAEILTQDATNPSNEAGIMIRDSVSNTARFAFVGTTSSNGAFFEYRSGPGGNTTTISLPSIAAPYWVKLLKNGTTYSAYVSPSGISNTWTQIGMAIDLGFGSDLVHLGMAVTSTNNSALSTATFTNFSDINSPLPVNLISFTATNVNAEYISLKWATSNEINSDYFEVERSNDGVSFKAIGKVKAAGNSLATQYYSFNDENPLTAINYYRLKQFDINGNIYYSNIVVVNFGKSSVPIIFPNPAKTYFNVIAGADPLKLITVFDASGKTILQKVCDGSSSFYTIPTNNFAAGVYIIKITTDRQVYEQKLFKQ